MPDGGDRRSSSLLTFAFCPLPFAFSLSRSPSAAYIPDLRACLAGLDLPEPIIR